MEKADLRSSRFRISICSCIVIGASTMLALAGSSSPQTGKAQAQTGTSDGAPHISLMEIDGTPGSGLIVPLYFTPGNLPLRSVTLDITFVGNHLKFDSASQGILPKGVTMDIDAKSSDMPPDTKGIVHSTVRLSISLTGTIPPTGIPKSLLAYLLLNVSPDAKPFAISLVPTLVSAEDLHTPPQQVSKVEFSPGKVIIGDVEVAPEMGCFFFNH